MAEEAPAAGEKKKEKATQHDLKRLREIYLKVKLALLEEEVKKTQREEANETEEEEYPKWKTII